MGVLGDDRSTSGNARVAERDCDAVIGAEVPLGNLDSLPIGGEGLVKLREGEIRGDGQGRKGGF